MQLAARVEAPVPERRELLQALLAWASATRDTSGVLAAYVYEDVEAPAAFYLVSQWSDRDSMEAHLGGPQFGAVLGALEVLAGRPTVQITQLGARDPQDALAAIRRLRSGGAGAAGRRTTDGGVP